MDQIYLDFKSLDDKFPQNAENEIGTSPARKHQFFWGASKKEICKKQTDKQTNKQTNKQLLEKLKKSDPPTYQENMRFFSCSKKLFWRKVVFSSGSSKGDIVVRKGVAD